MNFSFPTRKYDQPTFLYQDKIILWQDFCNQIAQLSEELSASKTGEYLLYCQDSFLFAVGFFALLKTGKTIILPQNLQSQTVANLANENCALLTDTPIHSAALPVHYISYNNHITGGNDNFPATLATTAQIIFHTSGSTGEPKKIRKTLRQLLEEVCDLEKIWPTAAQGQLLLATVSHQHIYGLLHRLLWPLYRGDLIDSTMLFAPETLADFTHKYNNIILVSSPAFLKRVAENGSMYAFGRHFRYIFSSGGALDNAAAKKTAALFGATPYEILGSTETGGIAYRQQPDLWTRFARVSLKTDAHQRLFVSSPYILGNDYITTGDTAELINDTQFTLRQRADRIVKLEEKRVSLCAIEDSLRLHEWVEDCHTVLLENHRQVIGCAVVLTKTGSEALTINGKKKIDISLRKHLLQYFEAVVLPRKWRYVKAINTNPQGKILQLEIKELFK